MSGPPPDGVAEVARKRRPKRPKRRARGVLVRRTTDKSTPAEVPVGDASRAPGGASLAKRRGVRIAVAALAATLVAGGVYLATRTPDAPVATEAPAAPKGLLDAIPAGALAVVTADVRALRASPLAAPYLGGSRSVPGFDDVRQACGFDLIASVDELAIAIPEGGDADFGIVAMGGFSDSAILDCASKVVESRGGEPVVSTLGSFKSVRDAASQASSGETAARPGGLLLWGGGPYVRTMIDAADGAAPTLRGGSLHEKLRAELTGYETIQISYVFSDAQRAIVADEITQAQGRAPAVLAHVVGAGLGVRLVGDKTALLLVLVADDPSHAPELRAWIEQSKKEASSGLASRLLGVGGLLDRVEMQTTGTTVRAKLDATVSEIDSIVDRAFKVRAMLQKQEEQPQPQPDASTQPVPSTPPVPSTQPTPSTQPVPSMSVAPR